MAVLIDGTTGIIQGGAVIPAGQSNGVSLEFIANSALNFSIANFTGWFLTLANTQPVANGFWNNNGVLTYYTD